MEQERTYTQEEIQTLLDSTDETNYEGIKQHLMSLGTDEERMKYLQDFAANQGNVGMDAQDAMTRADSLRVAQPGMGGDPGGYQVAASPLEHIGAGMQNYQAQKQYDQGKKDLGASRAADNEQRVAAIMAQIGGMPGGPTGASGKPITAPSMGGPPGGMPMGGPQGRPMGGPAGSPGMAPGVPGGPPANPGGMNAQQMAMALRSR